MNRMFCAVLSVAASCAAALAFAQPYPSKPVRVVNPFPAGGPADSLVRPIAQKLSEALKVPLVIDTRPGANGAIGTQLVVKSPPDGYTLVVGSTSSLPMNAAINPKLPFDPVKDLAPVSGFAYTNQVLVIHPSLPVRTTSELIAFAKARPGQVAYASPGSGSSPHFAAEMFSSMTGIRMLHVPYRGGAPATVDLLAGQVMLNFDSMQNAMQYVRAGRLRALGVAALKRSAAAPDVPTIAESGVPGFEVGTLFGFFAPANTPKDIVSRLHGETARVLALPEIRQPMLTVGTEPVAYSPEELGAIIRSDMVKWAKVAREANIRAE